MLLLGDQYAVIGAPAEPLQVLLEGLRKPFRCLGDLDTGTRRTLTTRRQRSIEHVGNLTLHQEAAKARQRELHRHRLAPLESFLGRDEQPAAREVLRVLDDKITRHREPHRQTHSKPLRLTLHRAAILRPAAARSGTNCSRRVAFRVAFRDELRARLQRRRVLSSPVVDTQVLLVRHGVTDWHREGKLLGHRDIALSDEGLAQARSAAEALAGLRIAEVISSPLLRALQTAELIGARFGIEIARDPRLIDFRVGQWEGMRYADIAASSEYNRFITDPLSESIPGGENLAAVRQRAVAAIDQALEDNPTGDAIAVITHAGIIRVLLTHYLGSPAANYHKLRVVPGSVSVLSFDGDDQTPRVLAINWCAGLEPVVAP